MENFKNIVSTMFMMLGFTMSTLDALEQWSRIAAALITVIVGLITIIRNIKGNGK